MPKLKTNKSAAKRFKRTKSGKFKKKMCFASHLMTGKSAKRRRRLRKMGTMDKTNVANVARMLPYGS
ncbi:MAG TPA: 50S ribosomal protein L35 [Candidatus Hydrogenedentes bacterium]|nr:50S ribosomal protein L35 [Candidatus Hydrogenedentota bacterium]